jgi:hypothetical protein
MLAKQNPYPQEDTTHLPDTDHGEHMTLSEGCHGFNNGTPAGEKKGCHTHYSGPGMLISSNIPTMQHCDNRTRDCPAVP